MSALAEYVIRRAGADDLPLVLSLRKKLFLEMEIPPEALVPDAAVILKQRYELEFRRDSLAHFIAWDAAGDPAACVGTLIKDDFPYLFFKPGCYGQIVDVFTEPPHRGKGLSRKLLQLALDWLRSKGIREAKLVASGSDAARLYQSCGFHNTWDFFLPLDGGGTYNDYVNEREDRRQNQRTHLKF